jgi:hypothetical protein
LPTAALELMAEENCLKSARHAASQAEGDKRER